MFDRLRAIDNSDDATQQVLRCVAVCVLKDPIDYGYRNSERKPSMVETSGDTVSLQKHVFIQCYSSANVVPIRLTPTYVPF